ncbi:penicillin-binding protein 1A [Oceanidesulfovibrio marinus]|uniref:peptidoglycan glycosyltransferase n=1 Tax=Oceanidesulfovibrio marinus TaxID=370038 RepID=A0ABX6NKW2_9BACT|nr:PBP1A family penicillin-binding protein [Oceanidesulfovibrio marinus]QJT10265.1 PBP1A family penicillin-binding protein [Oceanidesulfovibrio marinus]
MGTKHYIIVALFVLIALLACLAGAVGYGMYLWAARDLPAFTQLTDYRPQLVTTVYARDGQILGYLARERRFLVSFDQIPEHARQAFLAMEDHTFYEHEGVDISAIIRAFFVNMQHGSIVQGGSTINQQIIKRLLLTSRKNYERKLKEAILAYRLQSYLTKDEILTIYLNEIFFGAGAYGIEAAARTYFGKHAADLSLAEAALLAGLPKAPSTYNPFRHPEAAKERQETVLRLMLGLQWITQEEYDAAVKQPLVYTSMPDPSWGLGAYYLEEVRRLLLEELSQEKLSARGVLLEKYGADALYESGLSVNTSVDLFHQAAAEAALRQGLEDSSKRRGWIGPVGHIEPAEFELFLETQSARSAQVGEWTKVLVIKKLDHGLRVRMGSSGSELNGKDMAWAPAWRRCTPGDVLMARVTANDGNGHLELELAQSPKVQGAVVSMQPRTGEVLALVGGYDFTRSQFNRATQAHRQPGSAFKPVVYSAALDAGFKTTSVIDDAPVTFGTWSPGNYKDRYSGPITLKTALTKSKNVVTAKLANAIGIKRVIRRARALGLEGEFPPYLPISLGAQAVSPLNLCQAYTAFADGGLTVAPRFIRSVQSSWGVDILRTRAQRTRAITPENAYTVTTLLQNVVQEGTGRRARALDRPVAGKTGTTNEERDAWFMGFAPYLLTGVYVGFDDLTPMGKGETGSRAALPVWLAYRQAVEQEYAWEDFPEPPAEYSPIEDLMVASLTPGQDFLPLFPQQERRETAAQAPAQDEAATAAAREAVLKRIF